MKKRSFFLSIVLIFSVAFAAMFLSTDERTSAASLGSTAKVTLNKLTPLSELADKVKQYEVKVAEFQYAQGDIQGGYVIQPGESVDDAVENFLNAHNAFLATAIAKTDKDLKETKDKSAQQRLSVLRDQLTSAQSQTDKEGLSINLVGVKDKQSLDALEKAGLVKSVVPAQKTSQKVTKKLGNLLNFRSVLKLINTAKASLWHEPWAPYGGSSDVNQSYTYQTFYFNNVFYYGSADTYEHETQVYNNNFANFGRYWSSNMPSPYYDTPFSDSIDTFTVGTFSGASLQTYTQYYTYMSLSAGSASNATVRIKGQKGHRSPSWCYSTWCVFADATTQSMAVFTAPAGLSWQY